MRLFQFVAIAVTLLLGVFATDNGLQTAVEWDNGSLMVNGERVLVISGEFRKNGKDIALCYALTWLPCRLPTPSCT